MAELRTIPIDQIRNSPHNPRGVFDNASLATLANSISRLGVLQPVLVTHNEQTEGYELIAGERRWRASQLAKKIDIPALVVTLDDPVLREVQIVENLEREQLNPIDEALALQCMIDLFGFTEATLANHLSRSPQFVRQRLSLLRLDPAVRQQVAEGTIGLGAATEISAIADLEEQRRLAQTVIENELSIKQTATRVSQLHFERRLRTSQASRRLNLKRKTEQLAVSRTVVSWEEYDPQMHHRTWDLLPGCLICTRKGVFVRKDGQVEDVCVDPACYATSLQRQRDQSTQQLRARKTVRLAAFDRLLQAEDITQPHLQYLLWSLVRLLGSGADTWRTEVDGNTSEGGAARDNWQRIEALSEEQLLTGIVRLSVSHMSTLDNDALPVGLRQSLIRNFGIPPDLLDEGLPVHEA